MTTRYQIRRPDLSGIFIDFDTEDEALDYWDDKIKHAPPTDRRHGAVVVRHTFESRAQAETARLDWLEKHGRFNDPKQSFTVGFSIETVKLHTLRAAIDAARNAPRPETVIIWPKPAAPATTNPPTA